MSINWNNHIDRLRRQITDLRGTLRAIKTKAHDERPGLEQTTAQLRELVDKPESQTLLYQFPKILHQILHNPAVGAIILGPNGEHLLFNSAAERLLGSDLMADALAEKTGNFGFYLTDKVTKYTKEQLPWQQAVQGRVVPEVDLFVRRQGYVDGLWIKATSTALKSDTNDVGGAVVFLVDITEQVQVENQIQSTCEALEQQISSIGSAQLELQMLTEKLGKLDYLPEAAPDATPGAQPKVTGRRERFTQPIANTAIGFGDFPSSNSGMKTASAEDRQEAAEAFASMIHPTSVNPTAAQEIMAELETINAASVPETPSAVTEPASAFDSRYEQSNLEQTANLPVLNVKMGSTDNAADDVQRTNVESSVDEDLAAEPQVEQPTNFETSAESDSSPEFEIESVPETDSAEYVAGAEQDFEEIANAVAASIEDPSAPYAIEPSDDEFEQSEVTVPADETATQSGSADAPYQENDVDAAPEQESDADAPQDQQLDADAAVNQQQDIAIESEEASDTADETTIAQTSFEHPKRESHAASALASLSIDNPEDLFESEISKELEAFLAETDTDAEEVGEFEDSDVGTDDAHIDVVTDDARGPEVTDDANTAAPSAETRAAAAQQAMTLQEKVHDINQSIVDELTSEIFAKANQVSMDASPAASPAAKPVNQQQQFFAPPDAATAPSLAAQPAEKPAEKQPTEKHGKGKKAAAAEQSDAVKRRKILIVDDIPVNQKLLRLQLKRLGYECEAANNGDAAQKAITVGDFALILMDLDMPIMDGFESTAAIRKNEQGQNKRIPIVAMTSYDRQEDREKCLAVGMDDFLSKGATQKQLHEVIERCINAAASQDSAQLIQAALQPPPVLRETGLDIESLQKQFDKEEVQDVSRLFLSAVNTFIDCIQLGIEEKDAGAVTHFAHSVKGPCAALGIEEMTRLTTEIMADAEAGNWTQVRVKYMKLKSSFGEVRDQLRELCTPGYV